jgi:nucleoside permease NupC
LCGFSNLGSIGISVGSLVAVCPDLKRAVMRDVMRALVAGTLACFSTACVASALFDDQAAAQPNRTRLATFDCS